MKKIKTRVVVERVTINFIDRFLAIIINKILNAKSSQELLLNCSLQEGL